MQRRIASFLFQRASEEPYIFPPEEGSCGKGGRPASEKSRATRCGIRRRAKAAAHTGAAAQPVDQLDWCFGDRNPRRLDSAPADCTPGPQSACGARPSLQAPLTAPRAQAAPEALSKKWRLPLFDSRSHTLTRLRSCRPCRAAAPRGCERCRRRSGCFPGKR